MRTPLIRPAVLLVITAALYLVAPRPMVSRQNSGPGDCQSEESTCESQATSNYKVVLVKFCKLAVGQTGPLMPGWGPGRGRLGSALPWSVL